MSQPEAAGPGPLGGFFLAAKPNLKSNITMTMKHPAEWAMDHIAAMRRNRRSPNKIARYAIMAAGASDFPIEKLDLTADERAAVDREVAAAKANKKKRTKKPK
jgi:hypothetical protein